MITKNLKILLTVTILAGFTNSAVAEEGMSNDSTSSDYDTAYEKCGAVADMQNNSENWQSIFDLCMKEKGFSLEEDKEENESQNDDTNVESYE